MRVFLGVTFGSVQGFTEPGEPAYFSFSSLLRTHGSIVIHVISAADRANIENLCICTVNLIITYLKKKKCPLGTFATG